MYNIPWRHSAKHHTAFNNVLAWITVNRTFDVRCTGQRDQTSLINVSRLPVTNDNRLSQKSRSPIPFPSHYAHFPPRLLAFPVYRSHRLTCIIHRDTVKQRWLLTRASCSRKLSLYDKKLSKKCFINFLINYRNITVILPALQTPSCTHLYLSGHSSVMIKFPDFCPDISSEHLQSIDPCNGSNRKRNEC